MKQRGGFPVTEEFCANVDRNRLSTMGGIDGLGMPTQSGLPFEQHNIVTVLQQPCRRQPGHATTDNRDTHGSNGFAGVQEVHRCEMPVQPPPSSHAAWFAASEAPF
jgi:hypothetical protein